MTDSKKHMNADQRRAKQASDSGHDAKSGGSKQQSQQSPSSKQQGSDAKGKSSSKQSE